MDLPKYENELNELFHGLLDNYDCLSEEVLSHLIEENNLSELSRDAIIKGIKSHLDVFNQEANELYRKIGDESYAEGHPYYEDMWEFSLMQSQAVNILILIGE